MKLILLGLLSFSQIVIDGNGTWSIGESVVSTRMTVGFSDQSENGRWCWFFKNYTRCIFTEWHFCACSHWPRVNSSIRLTWFGWSRNVDHLHDLFDSCLRIMLGKYFFTNFVCWRYTEFDELLFKFDESLSEIKEYSPTLMNNWPNLVNHRFHWIIIQIWTILYQNDRRLCLGTKFLSSLVHWLREV